jgi:hypothetical protein
LKQYLFKFWQKTFIKQEDWVLDGINPVNNPNFVDYNFKNYFDQNINGNS